MNKMKTFTWLGAGALVLSLASCSNDDLPVPAGEGVTFKVSLPADLGSRTFSDGLSADHLYVAIYDANDTNETKTPLMSNFNGLATNYLSVTPNNDGTFLVTAPLAKGVDYDIVFWAQSYEDGTENIPYSYNPASQTISINYEYVTMNDDAPDAFYHFESGIDGDMAGTYDIVLKRPFAQINVGASDFNLFEQLGGVMPTKTGYSFPAGALATTFDLSKGQAGTPSTDVVTLTPATLPAGENFPLNTNGVAEEENDVKYLAMAYVLVGDETSPKATFESISFYTEGLAMTGAAEGAPFRVFDLIPAQQNYRTNIYGNLFTQVHDFNVTIDPIYTGTTPYQPTVWDGTTYTTPKQDEDGNYIVDTADKFAGIYNLWNQKLMTADTKIIITQNFDMSKGNLKSMGNGTVGTVKGELDGQGHTIKGTQGPIFNMVSDMYIHDLNVISKPTTSNSAYSALVSQAGGTSTFENINISSLDGALNLCTANNSGFGAIVGLVNNSANVTLTNCVNKADITGTLAKVGGGLVGTVGTSAVVTVTNCKNYGNLTVNPATGSTPSSTGNGVGGIIGGMMTSSTAIVNNCYNYGDITWTTSGYSFMGGIIGCSSINGTAIPQLSIKNCVNEGNLTLTNTQIYCYNNSPRQGQTAVGGIYGGSFVDNYNYNSADVNMKTISGCKNKGNIYVDIQGYNNATTGGGINTNNTKNYEDLWGVYTGGIMGLLRNSYITINNCENTGSMNVNAIEIESTTGKKQPIYMAGICNLNGVKDLILQNNTVGSSVTMTSNLDATISGIYNWFKVLGASSSIITAPITETVNSNTNGTSYNVSNR